jgi:hypothetical protein
MPHKRREVLRSSGVLSIIEANATREQHTCIRFRNGLLGQEHSNLRQWGTNRCSALFLNKMFFLLLRLSILWKYRCCDIIERAIKKESGLMKIRSMEIENFKAYVRKRFVFDESFTLIVGDNGTGKTTILEALS